MEVPEEAVLTPIQWWWSSDEPSVQFASLSFWSHWLTDSAVPSTSIMMCDVWFTMRRNVLGSACRWIDWRARLPRLKTVTSKTSDELNSSLLRPWRWRLISVWANARAPLVSRPATCATEPTASVLTLLMTSLSLQKQKIRHVTFSEFRWLGLCVPIIIHGPLEVLHKRVMGTNDVVIKVRQ